MTGELISIDFFLPGNLNFTMKNTKATHNFTTERGIKNLQHLSFDSKLTPYWSVIIKTLPETCVLRYFQASENIMLILPEVKGQCS